MKISGHFHAESFCNDAARASMLCLSASSERDAGLLEKLLAAKRAREEKAGEEVLLQCSLELPSPKRAARQNGTAFKIISLLFESQEGRKPAEGGENVALLRLARNPRGQSARKGRLEAAPGAPE